MKHSFHNIYKTVLTFAVVIFGLSWISSVTHAQASASFDTVLDWMYSNGLTRYNNAADFRPNDEITRGEAAKFVAQYAQFQWLEKTHTECSFSDIGGYDSTLTPHIQQACFYGLLKGSNGTYRPEAKITEAEALTVTMRSIYGSFNEAGSPRWIAYYNRGDDLWLITTETLRGVGETNITRAKMGRWFYQAAQLETEKFTSTVAGQAQYTKYTESAFDRAIQEWQQVALFFHAKRCPICHGVRDIINENIDLLPADVRIFEADYDNTQDLQLDHNVRSQTTFVFFDDRGNSIETSNTIHTVDLIDALNERFE